MARRKSVVRPATIGAQGTRVYFGNGSRNQGGIRVARTTRSGQRTTRKVARSGVRITGQRAVGQIVSKGRIQGPGISAIGSRMGGSQKRSMLAGAARAGYVPSRRRAVALRQG